jgi:protein gp37
MERAMLVFPTPSQTRKVFVRNGETQFHESASANNMFNPWHTKATTKLHTQAMLYTCAVQNLNSLANKQAGPVYMWHMLTHACCANSYIRSGD